MRSIFFQVDTTLVSPVPIFIISICMQVFFFCYSDFYNTLVQHLKINKCPSAFQFQTNDRQTNSSSFMYFIISYSFSEDRNAHCSNETGGLIKITFFSIDVEMNVLNLVFVWDWSLILAPTRMQLSRHRCVFFRYGWLHIFKVKALFCGPRSRFS